MHDAVCQKDKDMQIKHPMAPAEIMEAIRMPSVAYPTGAIRAAMAQREAMTPLLLEVLEESLKAQSTLGHTVILMTDIHAMFLLASFREPRAYPLIVAFLGPTLAPPDECDEELYETLPKLLASVACGNPNLIQRIIETPNNNNIFRKAAFRALLVMVAVGELSREWMIGYLKELYAGKLEPTLPYVWAQWINCVIKLGAVELKQEMLSVAEQQLSEHLPWPQQDLTDLLSQKMMDEAAYPTLTESWNTLISNPVEDMSWWPCFHPEYESEFLAWEEGNTRAQLEAAAEARKKAKAKAKRKQADVSRRKNRKNK